MMAASQPSHTDNAEHTKQCKQAGNSTEPTFMLLPVFLYHQYNYNVQQAQYVLTITHESSVVIVIRNDTAVQRKYLRHDLN